MNSGRYLSIIFPDIGPRRFAVPPRGGVVIEPYYQKVLTLAPIAYWPLWETSGTVAEDIAGGMNGTYGGSISLGSMISAAGKLCPTFDGVNDEVDIYSAAFNTAFNTSEGSMLGWAKVAQWDDGADRRILEIRANSQNRVSIHKLSTDNLQVSLVFGAVSKETLIYDMVTTDWFSFCLSWSKSNDRFNAYINGYPAIVEKTGLGTWSGVLDASYVSIGSLGFSQFHKGGISDIVIVDREVSAEEAMSFTTNSNINYSTISTLGDSISTERYGWNYIVSKSYNNGVNILKNHAVFGEGISSGMDGQAVAAVNDSANIIVIALGTNDNNAGDMTALQAEYKENIAELMASNPLATIYAMNVLPKWTDVGGGTPVDKSNIRTAIAAACTSQGIACWDTYTTPWIDAADTSDGVHPTAGGQAKIAAEVLARL